jgi:hypothetical protein
MNEELPSSAQLRSDLRGTIDGLQAENAELKRKLAEAAENACPCSGGGHTLTKCPYFRAEAAGVSLEVEQLERQRMTAAFNIAKGLEERWRSEFQKETRARDAAERKCAELSEALRAAEHELITLHNLDASDDSERLFRNPFVIDTSAALDKVQIALYGPTRRPAALASQPAPKEIK